MALQDAILTALAHDESSGYDLAKAFDVSVANYWTASPQQLYRELDKMEEAGLVTARTVAQSKRPDKRVFRLTPAGRKALRAFLFSLIYLAITGVLTLPWSIYAGWYREKQYGLTSQALGGWLGEAVIGAAISVVSTSLLLVAIYALIRRARRFWWAWAAGLGGLGLGHADVPELGGREDGPRDEAALRGRAAPAGGGARAARPRAAARTARRTPSPRGRAGRRPRPARPAGARRRAAYRLRRARRGPPASPPCRAGRAGAGICDAGV